MNKIEGRLPDISIDEYHFRVRELFGIVKDTHVTMEGFYREILENRKQINLVSLYLRVIFDTIGKLEGKDFISFKKQLEELKEFNAKISNKMKKYEEDASDFRSFKKIIDDVEKREKEKEEKRKNYRGPEYE